MPHAGTRSDRDRTDIPETRCPGCGTDLDLHQPDPHLPDRLLGTCPECKSWFVIDLAAGAMAPVPAAETRRG